MVNVPLYAERIKSCLANHVTLLVFVYAPDANMRHPTPSRVLRVLEAQEAELSNLPSLPDLAIEEYTDDFAIDESSESFPALQAGTGIDRPPSRISHSTPVHKASSAASRLSRSGSAERFAASLHNSRGSTGNRDRKQPDASFEISDVEHTPYQLADLSSLIIDEESGIAAPEFGLPIHPEPDDGALSDVLDSISLTSSSRKTDENDDEQPVRVALLLDIELPLILFTGFTIRHCKTRFGCKCHPTSPYASSS